MKIRFATQGDLDIIDDIYNHAILTRRSTADTVPYSRDERESWFRSHNPARYPAFVAVENGVVVGYGSLSAYRPRREALRYAAEVSYFVHPDHHRKGIGSQLLLHAIDIAPACNIKHLVAVLLGNNDASIGLLHKYGFSEWGRLPGIVDFDGKMVDHLIYGKTIL